ncbi:hypothetical protein BSKO_10733 [Bryopsis sp. KO-2023]|nr:hypothetical protein BSKO_10733 [Bryopsis sp. KO-2023]
MTFSVRRLLFCWGNGDFGRLGMGSDLSSVLVPKLCDALAGFNIKQVACGGAHTVALADSGEVWTFGLNADGQLGHSEKVQHASEPFSAPIPEPVVSIAAGHHHTLCLGESGSVWSFGRNNEGQLGLGKSVQSSWMPRMVDQVTGVGIAAGAAHSVVVTKSGEVFSWGRGSFGQLGHEPASRGNFGRANLRDEAFPRMIRDLRAYNVEKVYAGHDHSGAIDVEGRVFMWGLGRAWQLGLGHNPEVVHLPTIVGEIPGASSLALGCSHSIAVRHESTYIWGTNDCGVLGLNAEEKAMVPTIIPNLTLKQVSGGWKHSGGITPTGKLFMWGSGGSVGHPSGLYEIGKLSCGGQLGLGDDYDRLEPTEVKNDWAEKGTASAFAQISCGFNHTAALLEVRTED